MLTIPIQKNPKKVNSAIRGDVIGPYAILDQFRYGGLGLWKAIKASNTFTLTAQPANNETMTIDGQIYTFKTTLTPSANEIKIGASLAETQANIVGAVNGNVDLSGSGYGATTRPNKSVSMSNFAANVSTVTALEGGVAGNSIATTETIATGGSFSAGTLSGGVDESNADGILKPKNTQYNTGHTSSASGSFLQNMFSETATIGKEYAEFLDTYDDLSFLTNASKKYSILNYFGAQYKRVAKININSLLNETMATFGVNPSQTGASELDTNKFVIGDGNTGIQVVQINADGTVTVGTLFTHSQPIHKFVAVDTGKIIGIRNIGATSYEVMHFTVSGTTISYVGASTITVTGSGTSSQIDIIKIATGKAAMSYRNNTSTYGMRVADVTGALSVTGSDSSVTPTGTSNMLKLVQYDTDKFIAVQGTGTASGCRIYAINVTGTALAVGSAYTPTINVYTDTTLGTTNFAAFAPSTTNVVFCGYNISNASGNFQPFLEQISMSGTAITFVKTHSIEVNSTFTLQYPKFLNTDTNKWVLYMQSASNIGSRYESSNVLIPFTVSGSTVTMGGSFKQMEAFRYSFGSEHNYRLLKVGTNFVYFNNTTGGTAAPVMVFKPVTVEVYNHETLMSSFTIKDPFAANTLDLTANANAVINDDLAFIKLKNTDAQTVNIKIEKALVEFES